MKVSTIVQNKLIYAKNLTSNSRNRLVIEEFYFKVRKSHKNANDIFA